MKNLVSNLTPAEILRESEERYRMLFNTIDEGFCVCEMIFDDQDKPYDYRFLEINPTFEKQTGLENALGKTARELLPELEEYWYEIYGNVVLTGEPTRFVSGSNVMNRWFDVYAFRFGKPEERKFAILFSDVTERQRTEENQKLLLEISEKIRLAENITDLLFDISKAIGEHLKARRCLFNEIDLERDLETVHRDYCRGVESVAGIHPISDYSPVTTADMRAGRTVVNRDSQMDPRTAEFYEQIYAPNGERAYIAVPMMRDGRWVASLWISDDQPRNWSEQEIGLLESVAERAWLTVEKLRNETALRESEERFSKAFNTTPHLMTITTLEGGRYLSVNDSVLRATGYTRDEMIGRTADELNIFAEPEGRAKLLNAFQDGVIRDLEIKLRMKNGESRLIELSADIINVQGEKCILTSSIDITESKRAEEALRESEARFRYVADAAPVLIWISDTTKKCTWFNKPWLDFTGRTMEQEMGDGWTKDIYTDDLERCLEMYDTSFEARTAFSMEYRLRRYDGEYRWVLDNGVPRFAPSGDFLGYIGSCFDITERKLAEESVRDSEESYRILAETASDAIIRIDTSSTIQFVNTAAERVFGYSSAEMLGQPLTMLMPEEMRERHRLGLKRYLQTGKRKMNWTSLEVLARHKDGHDFPLEISFGEYRSSDKRFFIGVARDITKRKQAEELLRESEEKFRDLANSISQFAWMADATGFIFWYNQRWFEYTGTTLQEMQGWGWQKVHHPEEVERVTEKFKRHVASGEVWEDTFPLRSKTGEYRWFLSRALPIRDENGRIVRWFGTNTDIEEVRTARLQAEQANRLKDEFLATVSHELRTPLNAILGWSNMLQSGKADDEIKDRAIEVIYRNAKAQAQLIEDLLDVSRIITGKMLIEPRPVGFAPVIRSAIDTIRPAADAKSIELETDLDCEQCLIGGDPQRLQQIVWNLLSNAVKFTPEGGKVKVLLENAGSHARLTINDTGKGIEAKFLPFMFERFRQEDASSTRRHGGLGLGLAIVRHLVELHGGKIFAESAGENLGSTFTVELPLALTNENIRNEEAKNLRETLSDGFGRQQKLKKLKGIRVLLVDDELDTLEMLDTALTNSGAEVKVSSSARDAFEILEDWQPDVLVSDIAMPDEDGYSLIKKVRDLAPENGGLIPAIAMTAYVRAEDKMRVLASGFQAYIPKPAEPTELITVILDLNNLSSG